MKKIISGMIVLLVLVYTATAQSSDRLIFNMNGEFKIVQFTDTHVNLITGDHLDAYKIISRVIEIEKPDLVVFTGDIITQDYPQEGYRKLASVFEIFHIPWAVVFGNHESEGNYTRKELAGFLHGLPFCLNCNKNSTTGYSDFILPVYNKNKKPGALLYCMDSNSYSTLTPTVDGYGWFNYSQIDWYRHHSRNFTHANNGIPLPALVFFHIPLPEYTQGWNNQNSKVFGVKNEDECSPKINTGMFAAMLECGDVMGTFVGHDHYNDYICSNYKIALAYGRVSKMMKKPEDPLAGGRVIVLKNGKREFDTWIRDFEGKKVLECSYPGSFLLNK